MTICEENKIKEITEEEAIKNKRSTALMLFLVSRQQTIQYLHNRLDKGKPNYTMLITRNM